MDAKFKVGEGQENEGNMLVLRVEIY